MTWSRLQSCSNSLTGALSVTANFGSNMSAGSKLIALVLCGNLPGTTPVSSVKDTAGNSFSQLVSISGSATRTCAMYLYVLDTPAGDVGGLTSITATFTGTATVCSIICQEIAGLAAGNTTAVLDGTAGSVQETTVNAGQAQPAYSSSALNEFLVVFYGDHGDGSTATNWTAPAGYTTDPGGNSGSSNANYTIAYKNSTGGAESGTWTFTGSVTSACYIVVAFKLPATAGPAGTVQPLATIPVPRRRPVRVLWAGGQGQAFVAVPAPRQEYQLAPRRKLARGQWRGITGQAYVFVPAPVQQFRTAPRRKLARAYIQFTPVTTTNAAAAPGVAGSVPVLMANQARLVVRRDGRVVRQ